MHRRAHVFLLLITLPLWSVAQSAEIDSLKRAIKSTINENDIAYNHNRIAWLLIQSDTKLATAHLDTAQAIYTKLQDSNGLAQTAYKRATLLRFKGDNREALQAIDAYLNHFESLKDTAKLVHGIYQKGVILQQLGDYHKSNEAFYKTLDLYDKLKNIQSVGMTHNSLGINNKNLKNYDKALEHYHKALQIQLDNNDEYNLVNTYGNLGTLFSIQKKYDKALNYLDKALEIDKKTNNQWGIAINTLNRGIVYLEKGEPLKAKSLLKKALDIQQKNDYSELENTLNALAKACIDLGEYQKGEAYIKEALSFNPSAIVLRDLYENLSVLYEKQGEDKKALYQYKKYVAAKDSLFNIEKRNNINLLQYQYETKQKDNQITDQKLLLSEQENLILKKKTLIQFMIFIGSLLVLSLLAFLFYQRQKSKLKTKEIEVLKDKEEIHRLESFIEGEEKERARIAQDLHDGINGDLSVIKYKITSLENNHLKDQDAQEYGLAIQMLDHAIDQVRKISHDLTPPSLHNFSLVEAVQNYCQRVSDNNTIKMTFQHFGNMTPLSKEGETAIYRIIQELITNVIKHAKASEIMVQINCHEDNIHISIEDDGIGFDLSKNHPGIGLKNIDARVKLLKAELGIESNKNGTLTTINLDRKNWIT